MSTDLGFAGSEPPPCFLHAQGCSPAGQRKPSLWRDFGDSQEGLVAMVYGLVVSTWLHFLPHPRFLCFTGNPFLEAS